MGWSFEPVDVSTEDLPNRFLDLFFRYGCAKKTEAECLFPLIDVIRSVKARGFSKALTGFRSSSPTIEAAPSRVRVIQRPIGSLSA